MLLALAYAFAGCDTTATDGAVVTLATTHTIEDTGLLDALSQAFAADHPELTLRIVVAGSGEALALGRRGDADVLLTHAPEDEARFIADGHGLDRRPIMRNEFVLYGPAADPAGVRRAADIAEAFRRIRAAEATFISRGDDSGTHKRERAIWASLAVEPAGGWYLEAGVGQADALRIASERQAYILADRATFAVLARSLDLAAISGGDPRLVNTYSVLRVTGSAHPEGGQVLTEWLSSEAFHSLIRDFGTDAQGRPLFEPMTDSADRPGARVTPPDMRTVARLSV